MKRILSLLLLLTLVLTLFISCTETNNPASPPAAEDTSKGEREILNHAMVQRGRDGVRIGLQNDSSDKLRTLRTYSLVSDVENLLWIAPRGGAGLASEGEEKEISALPIIQESDKSTIEDDDLWFDDTVNSENVWIRLNYEPYLPAQGMNVMRHKDLIIYVDPANHDNAVLGVQNPQNLNKWTLFPLPGYGPWLTKEIDMLLWLTIAM